MELIIRLMPWLLLLIALLIQSSLLRGHAKQISGLRNRIGALEEMLNDGPENSED